eukprot:TRINITY_DN1246_c0_g1_i2.p1 TRINITY_DN1246_c0_g1~~TRINITY_DN1246_c0_g1_i2.p1  ORF type:complete len:305 (-),score=45.43 TRINITY_DN1246_c0_g1_i2:17-931(-)
MAPVQRAVVSSRAWVLLTALALASLQVTPCEGYKPIVMFHGVGGNYSGLDNIVKWIQQTHPGTVIHNLDLFNNDDSIVSAFVQVPVLVETINKLTANYTDGYHLLCHSQGSFLCRAVLEYNNDNNVDTFISLTGPHMGVRGVPKNWTIIPKVYHNTSNKILYKICYTRDAQYSISLANMWTDQWHYTDYLSGNLFLPRLNNQIPHPYALVYKANFLKTKKIVLLGSPVDGVLIPWQSAFFGYYGVLSNTVMNMTDQKLYWDDSFGLKTMYEQKRLISHVVPDAKHDDWIHREDLYISWYEQYLT